MQDKEKTVDIDTSGPEVEVELPTQENDKTSGEDKSHENERETKLEDGGSADDTTKEPSEQSNVRDENNEGGEVAQKTYEVKSDKQQHNTQAVEEYSEGVKKRIAKLTKKMREAERQREEALRYAESVKKEREVKYTLFLLINAFIIEP